jgi:SIR2-like domain
MITVFTGAGFSHLASVPLASQLFDEQPAVDRISRQRLIERVVAGWNRWHASERGTPEEYLAVLEARADKEWLDAVWFVGLRIALDMGNIEMVGTKPTVVRHNIDRMTGVPAHEKFWGALFRLVNDVTVITTNYDILCERGLRIAPRPRKRLPGFNYGNGVEQLAGGGYPSYSHIQKVACQGHVPILKLHGSVSWSIRDGHLIKYHDCRPAIRGDAAIIAPVTNKHIPQMFRNIWQSAAQALASTSVLVVIGYSLPPYDHAVRNLIKSNLPASAKVHVFDPYAPVASRYSELLPSNEVVPEPGLPGGTYRLVSILDRSV